MRRQHFIKTTGGGGIDLTTIPFYQDLVLYAPLDSANGTVDLVNNITPTTDTASSVPYAYCNWDNEKQAYLLGYSTNYSRSYTTALEFRNVPMYSGVGTDNITNRGITYTFDIMVKSSGDMWMFFFSIESVKVGLTSSAGLASGKTCLCGRPDDIKPLPYSWAKIVYSCDANKQTSIYKNGTKVKTWNTSSLINGNPTTVGIMQQNIKDYGSSAWYRDVRVYNRGLTASEVAQL